MAGYIIIIHYTVRQYWVYYCISVVYWYIIFLYNLYMHTDYCIHYTVRLYWVYYCIFVVYFGIFLYNYLYKRLIHINCV